MKLKRKENIFVFEFGNALRRSYISYQDTSIDPLVRVIKIDSKLSMIKSFKW